MKRVTIKDIAMEAGVSHQTVSKVINDRPSFVGQTTKNKIREIIKRRNYQPNFFAKSLKKQNGNCIGIMGTMSKIGFNSYTYTNIIQGAAEEIKDTKGDYSLNIFGSSFNEAFDKTFGLVESGMVQGLILMVMGKNLQYFEKELAPKLRSINLPFVVVHSTSKQLEYNNVGLNSFQAGYNAADYFVKLGHKKIAIYKWWEDNHMHSEEALSGFMKCLKDNSLIQDGKNIITPVDNKYMGNVYENAHATFKNLEDVPTAMYVRPDAAAYGCLKAFKERNINVPNDVSIIGNDNEIPASYFETDLTTFHHPFEEKGREAVKILVDLIEGKLDRSMVHQTILEPKLIERKTCGSLKS